jgi:hypothetical protein
MVCPVCHTPADETDSYCRRCGADLTEPTMSLVSVTSRLPAITQYPQLPRVATGMGAVALGIGFELLRRGLRAWLTRPRQPQAAPELPGIGQLLRLPDNEVRRGNPRYEVSETIIYMRRVIRSRD